MSGSRPAPGEPHGVHGRPLSRAQKWAGFKRSPYFPATVLLLILAAAAGLFAGSYTYAMANPTPHRIPTAVVSEPDTTRGREFVAGMDRALDASLVIHVFATPAAAREALEEQEVFAIVRSGERGVALDVASASGAAVAQLLAETAVKVGDTLGLPVAVQDVKPLQKGDPRGLALFYISLAAVIVGFVGSIQLSVHARGLMPLERIVFTVAYALLGAFAIAAVVDWLLGAVDLPFVQSWLILAFTMFTSGMVFTMFNTLIGRWAMLPTWGVMVLLGNPSSGGAVSWPLLPSLLGHIGRWLPPGASVNAQHTAVYYQGHQRLFPYLVLATWALVSATVFWVWRHRHPGGREHMPQHAAALT
ncbi:ABC transporter permease [Streptomyces sp. OfavH-34-F]|uniref:ABC transporter permease n=1 Tax=Streptomyces sp. OfavH-34-F TaxID=2917760 RepID=UPI001EF2B992|nr:ABC transporter permease [Streptomyces sp. OfavH-34-F]MCG7526960.1 ABC transporter permease [Streptomyces sp. OfavH-34-F]